MGKSKETMFRYECDNPVCSTVLHAPKDDISQAPGYHGATMEVRNFSVSRSVEWFACKEECIIPAINEALRKDHQA